ncbi:MAG: hypothetical protein HYZ28_22975 [Myxococcales bacterium]|nr:hypothetical protein [Myxococcales bacterium]
MRHRPSRDFFSELMKDSQSGSAGFLAERERWLRSVQVEGREELLFEFEMMLRGVERYFNLHNLPIDEKRPVVTRDFREELSDVRDAIDCAIRIARQLLDPDSDQKMVFRRYLESQLADDRERRLLIEEELDQDSPQESLFILRQSFDSLRAVIDHLLRLQVCSFSLFCDIGNLALREVVLNRFFRPFRPLEFRLEYDRIKSVPILEALSALAEADRRPFTVAFLALFRLLHYLSYVGAEAGEPPERRCRVILALVRSESMTLAGHFKVELAARAGQKRHQGAALKAARDIARETERIQRRLSEGNDASGEWMLQAAVDFTTLFRRQICTLASALQPGLSGEDLFRKLVNRSEMAQRLRADLWVLAELCKDAEANLRTENADAAPALFCLARFIAYFQEVSYQLLRYGDYEAFDRSAGLVLEMGEPPKGPVARARLAEDLRLFSQVAETTFAAVNRRSELGGRKFDLAEAKKLASRFRPEPA